MGNANTRHVRVAIIGAGTAGLAAVSRVKRETDDYVIIDDGPLGTTCARTGCMPSKVLVEATHDAHRAGRAIHDGLASGTFKVNAPAVMTRVRALRDQFTAGPKRIGEDKHFLRGRAKFRSAQELRVGDQIIHADQIIIATGTSPTVPAEWRSLGDVVMTSETIFEMTDAPRSCAVIGGGPLGLELSQSLVRLGCRVDTFTTGPNLGGLTDPVVQGEARRLLTKELNIHVAPPATAVRTAQGLVVTAGDVRVEVERALLSIGRTANTKDLGLEAIGVTLNDRGVPDFDPLTMQLRNVPNVYICGDVAGDRPVMHEASFEGRTAGVNAAAGAARPFARYPSLAIAFTDPNIAVVGQSFKTLGERDFAIGSADFGDQGRARTKGEVGGCLRVYGERGTRRILGAELICAGGEHLAHQLAFAIGRELTVEQFLDLPVYHPTLEEGLRTALVDLLRNS